MVKEESWMIYPVGLAIRNFLLAKGEASPYDFYKAYRTFKPTTSYLSIVKYFYILERLGLIEHVKTVTSSKGGFPKKLYRIVPGMEKRDEWRHPQVALYPLTRLGRRRYRKLKRYAKEKGISIQEAYEEVYGQEQ